MTHPTNTKLEKRDRVSQVSHSGDCLLQAIDINISHQFIKNIKNTQTRSRMGMLNLQTMDFRRNSRINQPLAKLFP